LAPKAYSLPRDQTRPDDEEAKPAMADAKESKQLLHLVFGGELKSPDRLEFADLSKLDIVGIYPNYAEAYKAWRGAAARTIDDAHVRYFVVHLHRLLDPDATADPDA